MLAGEHRPPGRRRRLFISERRTPMDPYRRFSALAYGAAALVSAATLLLTSFASVLIVALAIAVAAAADRFVNREAEPDERMRSFMVYLVGGIAGLLIILLFGSWLGSARFLAPLIGFGLAALFDYFVPPEKYQPKDPHRYGESPPVTAL
jgi:MFS family permease